MELPTLRQLEYAVAVAEERHFGRAAERALVSQPGLSSQIRELERKLGIVIFERGLRGVEVTPAGEALIERARSLLREAQDLTADAAQRSGKIAGHLRLAAIPTVAPYLLAETIDRLHKLWPEALLDVQELQTEPLVSSVEDGRVDLALLAQPVDTASLTVSDLIDDPFFLALPADHPAAIAEPIELNRLGEIEMLLLPEGHCLRDHALEACRIAGRVEQTTIHCSTLATICQLVAASVGGTLLPATSLTVEARSTASIHLRAIKNPTPSRTIALAWRDSDPRSAMYNEACPILAEMLRGLTRPWDP